MTTKTNDSMIDRLIAYETGEIDGAGFVALFAELIRTGQAWSLQGAYGRQAQALINNGIISPRGEITDYGYEVIDNAEGM